MPFIPDIQQTDSEGTPQGVRSSSFVPDEPLDQTSSKNPKRGLFARISESLNQGKQKYQKIAERVTTPKEGKVMGQNPISTGIQTVGTTIGIAGDIGFDVLESVTPQPIKDLLSQGLQSALETAPGEEVMKFADSYTKWSEKHPQAAADISGLINIASLIPVGRGAQVGAKIGTKIGTQALEGVTDVTKKGIKNITDTKIVRGAQQITGEASERFSRGTKAITSEFARKAEIQKLPEPERAAIRAEVPDEVLSSVKFAAPETRPKYQQMIDKTLERISNPRGRIKQVRPLEVPGKALVDAASMLSKELRKTGAQLGAVKRSLGGQEIDIPSTRQALLNDLDDIGLEISKSGKVIAQKGVAVEDDIMEVMQEVQKYIGGSPGKIISKVDARNLDRFRVYLRKSFTKKGVPLQGRARGLADKYRSALLDDISTVSSDYADFARRYSEQYQAIEEFTNLLGYKGSLEDITEKALKAGEVSRRVLGNAADRPRTVIDTLIEEAEKVGYKNASDVYELIQFADDLEKLADIIPSGSLAGQVERAGTSVVSKLPYVGPIIESVSKLGGPSIQNKLKVLREFIDSLNLSDDISPKE